jgi:hypothetical protein
VQGHLIYEFFPALWGALDTTYYAGGRTTTDGQKGEQLGHARLGLTVALSMSRHQSIKFYGSNGVYSRSDDDFWAAGSSGNSAGVEGCRRMWPEEGPATRKPDPLLKRCTTPSRSCRRGTMCSSRSNPKPSESAPTSVNCAGCCLRSQARRSPRLWILIRKRLGKRKEGTERLSRPKPAKHILNEVKKGAKKPPPPYWTKVQYAGFPLFGRKTEVLAERTIQRPADQTSTARVGLLIAEAVNKLGV